MRVRRNGRIICRSSQLRVTQTHYKPFIVRRLCQRAPITVANLSYRAIHGRIVNRQRPPRRERRVGVSSRYWVQKMRVLVIEDEPGVAAFVKKGLREASYAVDVADDGQTGFRLAASREYDTIVLDLML